MEQEANSLYAMWINKPKEIYRVGNGGYMGDIAKYNHALGGIRKFY